MNATRFVALVGAGLLLISCAPQRANPSHDGTQPPQSVQTATVRTMAFSTPLELSGSVVASRQAAVGAVAAGRVVEVFVRTGDAVVAGQPIARIDDASYRAAYAQARGSQGAAEANVAAARAQANAAASRLHLAEVTARRMAMLYREGAISQQQNDEAQADLASSRAALAQAQAQIGAALGSRNEAGAALSAAGVPLGEAVIRAPFDGVVLARQVDPGAVVGAGNPIATVQDNTHLELDVSVPEDAAVAIHPGSTVTVRVDALGGKSLGGHIRSITAARDAALRAADVKVDLPSTHGLLAGMFARVRIAGPSHVARAVPTAALVNRAGQDGVFAIEDTVALFVPVRTGATQGGWIEVGGLPAHVQRVAVTGVAGLTDGAAVAVLK